MPSDEITQKHLNKLRIRGAPSTIPGTTGFVGSYEAEEIWRHTGRALVIPLDRSFTAASLRETYAKLAEVAARQKLTVVEDPMFAPCERRYPRARPGWAYYFLMKAV